MICSRRSRFELGEALGVGEEVGLLLSEELTWRAQVPHRFTLTTTYHRMLLQVLVPEDGRVACMTVVWQCVTALSSAHLRIVVRTIQDCTHKLCFVF